MIEIVRIPEERKPILLGKNGSVKKKIESRTGTVLEVTDAVEITGEDPIYVIKAKEIVKAIGRGFSPGDAFRLLAEGAELHIISLDGETEKKRKRLFGRVIGNSGRSKKRIETETGAHICVQGKTLSVIGTPQELGPAEEAVNALLDGKTHAYAYKKMRVRKSGYDF